MVISVHTAETETAITPILLSCTTAVGISYVKGQALDRHAMNRGMRPRPEAALTRSPSGRSFI